jgi:hypothetical protein
LTFSPVTCILLSGKDVPKIHMVMLNFFLF